MIIQDSFIKSPPLFPNYATARQVTYVDSGTRIQLLRCAEISGAGSSPEERPGIRTAMSFVRSETLAAHLRLSGRRNLVS